ncbi:MAG: hypothetical protein ABH863_01160 [Candidatus Micrarchaeota archaeon]
MATLMKLVLLLVIFAQLAPAQVLFTRDSIYDPAMSDEFIVWKEGVTTTHAVYMYAIDLGLINRISSFSKFNPDIYGNKVVYYGTTGNEDLYVYDISKAKEDVLRITASASEEDPAIDGDHVAYILDNGARKDTYLFSFSTNSSLKLSSGTSYNAYLPSISGNIVVWQQKDGSARDDIYYHVISTGNTSRLTTNTGGQTEPDIYGNRIVWTDDRSGNWDIYYYDLIAKTESPVIVKSGSQYRPRIYGDLLTYLDGSSTPTKIRVYNFSDGSDISIGSTNMGGGSGLDVYKNKIFWVTTAGTADAFNIIQLPAPMPNSCTDSDGINYSKAGYVYGYLGGNYYNWSDFCINPATVREYYCSGTANASQTSACTYGCANGACLPQIPNSCSDSDGGMNVNVSGHATGIYSQNAYDYADTCFGNLLREFSCSGTNLSSTNFNCPPGPNATIFGCQNGACVPVIPNSCIDSDNGNNYNVSGSVRGNFSQNAYTYSDTCFGSILKEFSCSGTNSSWSNYNCPLGCSNSSCNTGSPSASPSASPTANASASPSVSGSPSTSASPTANASASPTASASPPPNNPGGNNYPGGGGGSGSNNYGPSGSASPTAGATPNPSPGISGSPSPTRKMEFIEIASEIEEDIRIMRENGITDTDAERYLEDAKVLEKEGRKEEAILLLQKAAEQISLKKASLNNSKIALVWILGFGLILLVLGAAAYNYFRMGGRIAEVKTPAIPVGASEGKPHEEKGDAKPIHHPKDDDGKTLITEFGKLEKGTSGAGMKSEEKTEEANKKVKADAKESVTDVKKGEPVGEPEISKENGDGDKPEMKEEKSGDEDSDILAMMKEDTDHKDSGQAVASRDEPKPPSGGDDTDKEGAEPGIPLHERLKKLLK